MNPKKIETYVDGLQKTLKEKLFFVDVLDDDFFKNKVIIDFGCGDGSVLEYISKHRVCSSAIFVAVDINETMLNYAFERMQGCSRPCYFFKNLSELRDNSHILTGDEREVVLIANSVLHELGPEQKEVYAFVEEFCDYFIVRDMCANLLNLCINDNEKLLAAIIRSANAKMLSEFVNEYGFSSKALIHFLLKYTYLENWETEIEEDYLSVDWMNPIWWDEIVYLNDYIQEWRRERVLKDFNLDISDYISSTHRQIIVKL